MAELIYLLQFQGPAIVRAGSRSRCHGFLGHLNQTEPLLMLLVTPGFSLLWRLKMSAVKKKAWPWINKPLLLGVLYSMLFWMFRECTKFPADVCQMGAASSEQGCAY